MYLYLETSKNYFSLFEREPTNHKRALPRNQISGCLDLRLCNIQPVKNKFLLGMVFCYKSLS